MNKVFLIAIIFLSSCSKAPQNYLKFSLWGKTHENSSYIFNNTNDAINIDIKVNDSLFLAFIIYKSNNKNVCNTNRTVILKGVKKGYSIESNLRGNHTNSNGVINGRYDSNISNDYIEFSNYQL